MSSENPRIPYLRKKAMALPLQPGVYIMKDDTQTVIYIGKAKKLRNRVSQYFGSDTNHTEKVRQMVARVDHFDYIVVESEFEALVLECSLIKQYQPKYNILLKDDKGYNYIRISPPPFSRITEAKQTADDGAKYLGPYMSGFFVKQAVDEANKIFGLSTCSKALAYGIKKSNRAALERPCLNHHIGQCCAPCSGRVGPEEYAERVNSAVEFLTQGSAKTMAVLQTRMEEAAERLDFEEAARLRDRIKAIKHMSDKQKVVLSKVTDTDILAVARGNGQICVEVFRFENGQLHDRENFLFDETEDLPAFRSAFLQQYYAQTRSVPRQIALDGETEDAELLEQFLSEKAGKKVHITVPQIGEQKKLVEMCRSNASERIAQQSGMTGRESSALEDIRQALSMSVTPAYIECYDISHTAGDSAVGGMVVFENGRPLKSAYRRFQIQSLDGQDDYASMREVISRRMNEYTVHQDEGKGFGRKPDLILLDGGAGHVAAVKPIVNAFCPDIPVFGLVKDEKHRTRALAYDGGEIAIHQKRASFTLLSTIQEEVHRFAITYHRQKRKKNTVSTVLLSVPGIGETRAKALLRQFGSVANIRHASMDELMTVKGMTKPVAEALLNTLQRSEPHE